MKEVYKSAIWKLFNKIFTLVFSFIKLIENIK